MTDETITVRSGINSMTLALNGTDTVEDVYNRTRTALNIEGTGNLRVVVDGDSYDYDEVCDHGVEDGTIVEFVKRAGTKGA